ncbi:hypothetical protein [Vibrio harveyi]|uniref:hypothetical protein n=1 Tax=Vibrio harveyi TaxID=669 RepID=UPI000402BD06|nr:hypothetical protein [Vibrio harveyi]
MKAVYISSGIIVFIIVLCLGIWFGIEKVYVEVEAIPTKTIFDFVTLIATIIAACGTLVATCLAIYAYGQWRKQQHEIELIGIRKKLIIDVSTLKAALLKLTVKYYMAEVEKNTKGLTDDIAVAMLELKSNIELYYVLSNPQLEMGTLKNHSIEPQGDFLDKAKEFNRIASGFYGLALLDFITSKPTSMTFNEHGLTCVPDSMKDFVSRVADDDLTALVKNIDKEINEISDLAMLSISKKNGVH